MFRNNKHDIHMVKDNKVVINVNDDKWIFKRNGISTIMHGHNSSCRNSLLGVILLK